MLHFNWKLKMCGVNWMYTELEARHGHDQISIRTRCTTLCDKVCQWLATDRWLSPDTPVSFTNKIDRHDITELLLKVALNIMNQPTISNHVFHYTVALKSPIKQTKRSLQLNLTENRKINKKNSEFDSTIGVDKVILLKLYRCIANETNLFNMFDIIFI